MFSRPALRSLFTLERVASQQQCRLLHQAATTSNSQNASDIPPPSPPTQSSSSITTTNATIENISSNSKLPLPPTFPSNLKITSTLASKLPYLQTQRPHYISAHLHDRPYLLTEGDHLRLPFLMPNVKSGDILRFNRASALGSRDYTLKGGSTASTTSTRSTAPSYIDERMFECRLRVLGVESEPLRIKEKTKRRQRHVQRVKSKHKYTVLRVMSVKIKSLEELLSEGAEIVKDDGDESAVIEKAE